jgi:hypothetical protein
MGGGSGRCHCSLEVVHRAQQHGGRVPERRAARGTAPIRDGSCFQLKGRAAGAMCISKVVGLKMVLFDADVRVRESQNITIKILPATPPPPYTYRSDAPSPLKATTACPCD